jgi:DNA-binding XRE family transcriptional regulator
MLFVNEKGSSSVSLIAFCCPAGINRDKMRMQTFRDWMRCIAIHLF